MTTEAPRRDLWILDGREQPDAAAQYRAACARLFDITLLSPETTFHNRMDGYSLGGAVLARCAGVPQRFERRLNHIAADSADSVLAVLDLKSAGWRGDYDGREASGGSGSIRLVDMSRPFAMTTGRFEALHLAMPRAALDPRILKRDFHGVVVAETDPSGRLLGGQMRAMWDMAARLSATEAGLAARAVADLFSAAILSHGVAAGADPRPVQKMLLASARQFIAERLGDPDLNPETVRERLGVSRSLLYKVFEPVGGVSGFIQGQRLDQAFDAILQDDAERQTLAEIGYGLGFRSDAHFSRAFKTRVGVAPGRLRRMGEAARQEGLSARDRPDDVFVWLERLL